MAEHQVLAALPAADPVLVDGDEVRRAIEYYADRGWTDGLPVVPVTESYLEQFLARTTRDPQDVVLAHAAPEPALHGTGRGHQRGPGRLPAGVLPGGPRRLGATCARRATRPRGSGRARRAPAPFLIVNGPIRGELGLNCRGNVFGSGFRANATIGRAIRLTAINCFGLRPHELDQATQGTPAKYTACIGENEEDSPWPGLPPSTASPRRTAR